MTPTILLLLAMLGPAPELNQAITALNTTWIECKTVQAETGDAYRAWTSDHTVEKFKWFKLKAEAESRCWSSFSKVILNTVDAAAAHQAAQERVNVETRVVP